MTRLSICESVFGAILAATFVLEARSGQATRRGAEDVPGRKRHSDKLRPVVVRHQAGTGPFLAVGVYTLTGEEAVLCLLEN